MFRRWKGRVFEQLSKGGFPVTRRRRRCPSFLFSRTFLFRRMRIFFREQGTIENFSHYSKMHATRILENILKYSQYDSNFTLALMFFRYLNEVAILILRQFLPQTLPKNPRSRNLARLTSSSILEQLIPYHPRHQLEKHSIRPSISINPGRGGYSNSSNPCFLPLRRDGGITTLSASKAGVLKQCGRIQGAQCGIVGQWS